MKLAAFLTSAALIVFGLVIRGEPFIIAGASVFLLMEVIDLVLLYRAAKLFRAGQWKPETEKNVSERIAHVVRSVILYAGLIGTLGLSKKANGYTISGAIIWVGAVACWLIAGLLTSSVAGIPLKIGYGGWSIDRSKRHRGRHR